MLDLLPAAVQATIRAFRTGELATLARDGTPIAWPVVALYQADSGRFQLTSSIGFPQKALNIRRDPRVSLLFSDPTGSGLTDPPAVLIQGQASAPDEIVTGVAPIRAYLRDAYYRRQPPGARLRPNFLARRLMDWYFMRLIITVRPLTVHWWPAGDFARPPHSIRAPGHGG